MLCYRFATVVSCIVFLICAGYVLTKTRMDQLTKRASYRKGLPERSVGPVVYSPLKVRIVKNRKGEFFTYVKPDKGINRSLSLVFTRTIISSTDQAKRKSEQLWVLQMIFPRNRFKMRSIAGSLLVNS